MNKTVHASSKKSIMKEGDQGIYNSQLDLSSGLPHNWRDKGGALLCLQVGMCLHKDT